MSLENMLLGLLREPASGYDLKRDFDHTVKFFWPAELSQVYPTLKRMEKEGLLESELKRSSKGPKRRVYSLTRAGQKALLTWLQGDPTLGDQRHGFIAQFFFMGTVGDERHTQAYITKLRDECVRRLETYETIERAWLRGEAPYPDPESTEGFHQYMALRSGLRHMAARIGWCDDVLRRLEQRSHAKKKTKRKHVSKKKVRERKRP